MRIVPPCANISSSVHYQPTSWRFWRILILEWRDEPLVLAKTYVLRPAETGMNLSASLPRQMGAEMACSGFLSHPLFLTSGSRISSNMLVDSANGNRGKSFFIESDDYGFVVTEDTGRTRKDDGRRVFKARGYCSTLEGAIRALVRMKIKRSQATTLNQLVNELKEIDDSIRSAIIH